MTDRTSDYNTSERVWLPLGGSSRQYRNRLTGEVISRRQYDRRFGNLSRQGFGSYEAKAKAAKSSAPDRAAMRPARGRRAVYVVHKLEEFKKAWSTVVRSKRGTGHVYVLIARSQHWQEQLMGRLSRPNIIVDIRMGFEGAVFDHSSITPFFQFLASWGIRHYKQFLARKGKPGDRVGVWVGYDVYEKKTGIKLKEVMLSPVREQPLSILSGATYPIDKQIAEYFVSMDSVDTYVQGTMLRVLIRR